MEQEQHQHQHLHHPQITDTNNNLLKVVLHTAGQISVKSQEQQKVIRLQQEIERQKLVKKQSSQQQVVRDLVQSSNLVIGQPSLVSLNSKAKLQGQGQVTHMQTTNVSTSNLLQNNKLNLNKKPLSIGQYTIGEIIGRGAHGKVYKATDANGKFVAVKLFTNFKTDLKSQISQEIALLKKLDHPNIVKYIDFVQKDRQLAIVLEFVECGSLEDLIKRHGGCFTETIVAVYIKQVLRGLEYLHGRNVIHRDIKGGNILTTREGVVKLADFGVATKLDEKTINNNNKNSNAFAGTPYWMAPEVIEMQDNITTACDIWSLGCTVFELLKGSPPNFDLNQFSAMIKIVKDAGAFPLPQGISSELTNFLNQCFLRNPEERPSATQLLNHVWLKKMSNEQKLGKIMSLKLPQEVTNTIRVHLKRQYERDNNLNTEVPSTIDGGENNGVKIFSPSTLVDDKQAIANIVKQQQFQSRNQNLTKYSSISALNDPQSRSFATPNALIIKQQDQQSQQLKTQESSAQKNLIKLQTQRNQTSSSSQQSKSPFPHPINSAKQNNFIDLRGTTSSQTTPQQQSTAIINLNNKQISNARGDFAEEIAPESQQVTEHHPVDENSPSKQHQQQQQEHQQHHKEQDKRSYVVPHQVVNIQLKSQNGGVGASGSAGGQSSQQQQQQQLSISSGSRNKSRAGEVQSSLMSSKTARENLVQWQTTVSGSGQMKRENDHVVKFQPVSTNTASFSKQFYSATAAPNSIQEDYASVSQPRHVPILADHTVQYFNNSRSPQNMLSNSLAPNHSQTSQDFSKGILNVKQTLMPDQQLHIYTQQVPKKSLHVPSAPHSQKNNQHPTIQPKTTQSDGSQINYQQFQQHQKPTSDFNSHSNLIARKPSQGHQQTRLSSQNPLNVPLSKDPNIKLQIFNKQAMTPLGVTTLQTLTGGTPIQQSQLNSALQTYEPITSTLLQHQRALGTRTALSTLSASSYPTQPLLYTSSEQIIAIHHPHHKSLGLIQKNTHQAATSSQIRQRSPKNPPQLIRSGFTASTAGRDLQYLGDELETQINKNSFVGNSGNQKNDVEDEEEEPAEGEVDDQSSDHEFLFTQVLERSMGRRPSSNSNSILNTQHQTIAQTEKQSNKNLKKFGKQEQIALAIIIATELKDSQNQAQTLEKACQILKELGQQTHFKEQLIKEIGFVNLVDLAEQFPLESLQLINQICEAQSQLLLQFFQAGIMPLLKSVSQLSNRQVKVEVAFFVAQIYEESVQTSGDLTSIFLSAGGLEILVRYLYLDYKTDQDLIMISIDSILVMFDKRRKLKFMSNFDLSKLLIKNQILGALTDLVPRLIRHAENQYRHGSSVAMNESETDASDVLKEQSNAERYLERAFDLLNHICQTNNEVRMAVVNSQFLSQSTIQACIYQCLVEPSAITFQLTKWFFKVVASCVSQITDLTATQTPNSSIMKHGIELLLLEMLTFYMGLFGHIQLASIYDNLKLVFTLVRDNSAAVQKVVEHGKILAKLKVVCQHLEQQERSRTKRCKLFQVCCQLWNEVCQAGYLKELKDSKVDQICLRILQKEVVVSKPTQKDQSEDLAEKVLLFFQTWQHQDRLIEYLIAENLKIFLLINQPKLFCFIIQRSNLLTKAMSQQKNLSLLLQMHQQCNSDQRYYYDILLHLRQCGLNLKNYKKYIKPPSEWNDTQQRLQYQQLVRSVSDHMQVEESDDFEEGFQSIDQNSQLHGSSESADTNSLLFS